METRTPRLIGRIIHHRCCVYSKPPAKRNPDGVALWRLGHRALSGVLSIIDVAYIRIIQATYYGLGVGARPWPKGRGTMKRYGYEKQLKTCSLSFHGPPRPGCRGSSLAQGTLMLGHGHCALLSEELQDLNPLRES